MKTSYKYGLTLVGICLLLTACVKNDLFNTPHPTQGAVTITTDWSAASADATQPTEYTLHIGTQSQRATGRTNTFKALLDPGKYDLLVHNNPNGLTISGTQATVNQLSDGSLTLLPDFVFSAATPLMVTNDDTLRVDAKMVQNIRTLTLVLNLDPGDQLRIASTTATLSGIASKIDLTSATVDASGDGSNVKPTFTLRPATHASALYVLSATMRLAGVTNSAPQHLYIMVTMNNGTTHAIETNLTEALKAFGQATSPLTLDAKIELPATGDFGATITDWNVVEGGNIDIH
ncbi:MAG: FimB/Mfa2 family fimbrial subunit [Alistipes sp.]